MTLIACLGCVEEAAAGLVVVNRRAERTAFSVTRSRLGFTIRPRLAGRQTGGSTAAAGHIDSHLARDLLCRSGNAYNPNVANNAVRPTVDDAIRCGLRCIDRGIQPACNTRQLMLYVAYALWLRGGAGLSTLLQGVAWLLTIWGRPGSVFCPAHGERR